MNYSTYRFTLDLQKHQSQMAIAVFKNDTAVKLYISLTDGGKPYLIGERSSAIFYGKRADSEPLIHKCEISESKTEIIYEFEPTTACVAVLVNAQIRLYGADQRLITAPSFTIMVDEKIVDDEDIDTGSDPSPLSALDRIFATESDRVEAELERDHSEAQRLFNEEARQENFAQMKVEFKELLEDYVDDVDSLLGGDS